MSEDLLEREPETPPRGDEDAQERLSGGGGPCRGGHPTEAACVVTNSHSAIDVGIPMSDPICC